jgi:hypothetical protein
MEMDTIVLLCLVGAVLLIMFPLIFWLVQWFLKRRSTLVENPIDVHEVLLHKMKKSGRRNLKGTKVRNLWVLGDNDYPGFRYASMYGVHFSPDCVAALTYNGKRHLSRVGMQLIPIELCGDVFSRNLTVNCRGFRFKSNYQIPIWPSEVYDPKLKGIRDVALVDKTRWESIIERAYTFFVTQEKSEQLHEENVNGIIESINTKAQATGIYQRDEHMANADASVIRGMEDERTSS